MNTIKESINSAYDNNMMDMRESIHKALAEKIAVALEERRIEISKNLITKESYESLDEEFDFRPASKTHWGLSLDNKPVGGRDSLHSAGHWLAALKHIKQNGVDSHPDGAEASKSILNAAIHHPDEIVRRRAAVVAAKHGVELDDKDAVAAATAKKEPKEPRAPREPKSHDDGKLDDEERWGRISTDDLGPKTTQFRTHLNSVVGASDDDGNVNVTFHDGQTHKIPQHHVETLLRGIDAFKNPDVKDSILDLARDNREGFKKAHDLVSDAFEKARKQSRAKAALKKATRQISDFADTHRDHDDTHRDLDEDLDMEVPKTTQFRTHLNSVVDNPHGDGNVRVTFHDGETHKIPQHHVETLLRGIDSFKNPDVKDSILDLARDNREGFKKAHALVSDVIEKERKQSKEKAALRKATRHTGNFSGLAARHIDFSDLDEAKSQYMEGPWAVHDEITGKVHSTHSTARKAHNAMKKLNDADYEDHKDDESRIRHNMFHSRYSTHAVKSKPSLSSESVELDEARAPSCITGTRKVASFDGDHGHTAEVRYSPEWKEYQVHHYKDGKHVGEKSVSYHDDKQDAINTAKYETNHVSESVELDEVLSKDAAAADWIHDFVHSDNPKFAGKSKKERMQMALAAYYAKQRNESCGDGDADDVMNLPTSKAKSIANAIMQKVKRKG